MIASLLTAGVLTLILAVICFLGLRWADDSYGFIAGTVYVVSCLGLLATLFLAAALAFSSFNLLGAPTRAQIINQEFGTNYTARDVFFAESLIDEVQQVKRKRIEIQGSKKDEVGIAVPAE